MNPDSGDFGQLRRLLALKRHEQPPPGYFNHFSTHVIDRIRAGERAQDSRWEAWLGNQFPWLSRAWESVQGKPLVGGLCGAAFCVVLLVGLIQSEQPSAAVAGPGDTANVLQAMIPSAQSQALAPAGPTSLLISNGVVTAEPRRSLFDELRAPQALPVNWNPGGAGPTPTFR